MAVVWEPTDQKADSPDPDPDLGAEERAGELEADEGGQRGADRAHQCAWVDDGVGRWIHPSNRGWVRGGDFNG